MGIIPKEQLANVRRWHIGAFDEAPQKATAPEPTDEPAPAPTVPPAAAPEIEWPTPEAIARIEDEARNNGHQAGFQAGYEEGLKAADDAIRNACEAPSRQLLTLAGNLQSALAEIDQQLADQLLDLATDIAGRLVCGALAVKPEILLPVIREAIAMLPMHHGHVTLRLNPDDAATIRPMHGEQFAQNGIQIVEDSEISPGGCIVRAGSSEVDATIETRWKRVLDTLGATPRQWLPL